MKHLKIVFASATQDGEPEAIVCGVLDSEKTVCGTETQQDKVAGITHVENTKAKIDCSICISIIRTCKRFKTSELAA